LAVLKWWAELKWVEEIAKEGWVDKVKEEKLRVIKKPAYHIKKWREVKQGRMSKYLVVLYEQFEVEGTRPQKTQGMSKRMRSDK
jgi:hypothetical protein